MPRPAILTKEQLDDVVRLLQHEPFESAAQQLSISPEALTKYLHRHLFADDDWTQSKYTSFFTYFVNPNKKPAKAKGADGTKKEAKPKWQWSKYPWSPGERNMRIVALRQRLLASGLNFEQLYEVTQVGREYWRQFVAAGLVKSEYILGRMRVPFAEVARLVREHPEVFDYMKLPEHLKEFFGFDDVGAPPRYKLITCRSTHIDTKVLLIPGKDGKPDIKFDVQSCQDLGGVWFWTGMYRIPTCPRCGLRATRISEEIKYSNKPGGEDEVRNALATKIGLRWKDGGFLAPDGKALSEEELVDYITQMTLGHSRERDRKLQLVANIKRYKAGSEH